MSAQRRPQHDAPKPADTPRTEDASEASEAAEAARAATQATALPIAPDAGRERGNVDQKEADPAPERFGRPDVSRSEPARPAAQAVNRQPETEQAPARPGADPSVVNSFGSTSKSKAEFDSAMDAYRAKYEELVKKDSRNRDRLPAPDRPGQNFDPAEVLESIARLEREEAQQDKDGARRSDLEAVPSTGLKA